MAAGASGGAGGGKRAGMGRRGNVIAIAVLVVVVVAAYVAFQLQGATSVDEQTGAVTSDATGEAVWVLVTDADGVEYTYNLSVDGTHTITTDEGYNIVVIEDGQVCVSEADCPNQDCVNTGKVDGVGEQIVCLPHELIVEVVSDSEEPEYDVVGR